ncbi:MAG: mannose-6-phosphate isomerase, partial [Sciscionella sp.]
MTGTPRPMTLPANQPRQFYSGGARIAALRGQLANAARYGPEDWVASTTTRFGERDVGLSTLPGGQTLRAAVHADPVGWLGEAHTERFGDSTALLVKLLDAGQR